MSLKVSLKVDYMHIFGGLTSLHQRETSLAMWLFKSIQMIGIQPLPNGASANVLSPNRYNKLI